MPSMTRRLFLEGLLQAGIVSTVGCGTILHPERRGQPAGPLDWKIVALDAVGLLLFFIPGVIAFAVDFSNGTIYLPPKQYGHQNDREDEGPLVAVKMADERITVRAIEDTITAHTAQAIELTPGSYKTTPLAKLSDFWRGRRRLETSSELFKRD